MSRSASTFTLSGVVFLLVLTPFTAAQQGGDMYFEQNCSSCHSIGGGFLAGPDLKNVTQRAERRWLVEFIRDPSKKIAAKDAYALKLQKEAQGMEMPAFADLNDKMGEAVLVYIESRSAGSHPEATIPAVVGDPVVGREIFTGKRQLSGGGAACIACHQAAGLPATGGKLGPDLTQAQQRLGGERGLSAWLQRPPTPVMRALYRNKQLNEAELTALVAFFGTAAEHAEQAREAPRRAVQLSGVGLSLVIVGVVGFVWRGRLHGVRDTIVRKREDQ